MMIIGEGFVIVREDVSSLAMYCLDFDSEEFARWNLADVWRRSIAEVWRIEMAFLLSGLKSPWQTRLEHRQKRGQPS